MIHLGVCYYPEHWPEARWAVDARLMREAGLTTVRLGEFAWALLEPEAGRYEFAWLDRAIATLAAEGLRLVLGTPTATPPTWLTAAFPEVLPVGADGQVRQPGSRRHVCVTSEVYRERCRDIVRRLAERYGRRPEVIGWQIDNELGCHDTARCYCVRCAHGFTEWLEARYGTLEALNEAWGTVFWSQRYADWADILPPRGLVYTANPGHWLDWCRYASSCQAAFLADQAAVLREHAPGQWLTHNLMGGFDDMDHAEFVKPLDMVGFDNYAPPGFSPTHTAMAHDRMRGLLDRPFWILEQPVGHTDWAPYNPTLRPGELRLRTFQAIAHGADGVLFFRWRAGHIGAEQLHSGILPHSGEPGRTYREVQALTAAVAKLPALGHGRSPVAMLVGEPNRWALRHQPHHQELRESGPDAYDLPYYQALHERGVRVDVLPPTADFQGYAIVIAATQYLVDDVLTARLNAYVEAGGLLVLGPRSGFKDATNRVHPAGPPGALRTLAGARVLEWDSPDPSVWNTLQFDDGNKTDVSRWLEFLEPDAGTEVVARYARDFYAGTPAVTCRRHGKGRVWYVGTLGEELWLAHALVDRAIEAAGLVPMDPPAGVEWVERGPVTFVLNHTPEKAWVELAPGMTNVLTGASCSRTLELPPFGADVLFANDPARQTI